MGFYTTGSSGTVSGPADYDAEAASKKLYEGMKGLGTDENVIVEVISSHTNEQRQEIKDKYKTMYGKDLVEDLETELGGSFAKIVLGLMKLPEEYIVESINQAISGLGTDEYALIGLLCTRTNDELDEIKKAYKEKFEKEMEEDVAEDLSGEFRSLVVGIINGGRDESEEVDSDKVKEDAKNLLEASEGAGTREEVFQSIFNQRSYEHMRQVFEAYKELAEGKEIEELIESEFSGSLQAAYMALVKIFKNVAEFYAERLKVAIKGAGTDDETLIRIIVDLKDIIDSYESKADSKLVDDIVSDTSGDYKLILEKLVTQSEAEVEEEVTATNAGDMDETVPPEAEGEEKAEGEGEEGGDEEKKEGDDEEKKEDGEEEKADDAEEAKEGGDEEKAADGEDGAAGEEDGKASKDEE
ncbi:Annexin A13 [Orchesella cincta]|uniref:Annexin n=1 Tax=Orchesella cincta TaxID=48709 RepID=A0A1D2NCQ9_ORCCI|nr:Annexin A13 [Orchesella cincta]